MGKYFDEITEELNKYFHTLSKDIPDFLYEYVEAPELKRLSGVGIACGTDHTKIFNNRIFYSRLDHSVGVALIVWHFTKDKKQTLAGLFHDIANPAFSHCIDFFHGDYENQESTEEPTTRIIASSEYIMNLLKRDNIKLEEVDDYKIYPIADNNTPRMSADRLEYNFSNGFSLMNIWEEDDIKKIYENIKILKNEDKIEEIGFENPQIAEYFVDKVRVLWEAWISNRDRFVMQCIADILKLMIENNLICEDDFYKLSEKEILELGKKSGNKRICSAINSFEKAHEVFCSETPINDKYCINVKGKYRYINPLIIKNGKAIRLTEVSEKANEIVKKYLKYDMTKFIYSNFNI